MVGTIALSNGAGERLETIYLGQAPQPGKADFLDRLDGEWQRICQRYPAARCLGLGDGARDHAPWLAERAQWQILDFYHASGYLAGAAPGIARTHAGRARWLGGHCHALKHEPGAAPRLCDALAAQVEAGRRTRSAAPALEAASGYFAHNIERMNYAVFQAMDFPIGSGVTEAAGKNLVRLRLCGSGMRWTRSGAQTVIMRACTTGFMCQLSSSAPIWSSSRAMRSPALPMLAMASSSTTRCAACGSTSSRR